MTITAPASIHRPVGVTVIAVIAFIQATFSILGGIALLIERNSSALIDQIDRSSGTITTYGVAAIIWGIVAFFVAWGLWGGAPWARIIVTIVELLAIGGGIYLLFAWGGTYVWNGIWQILIGLVVLALLYGGRSDEFFGARGR
jgi:hypothetical protein